MATKRRNSISERLNLAQVAITNTLKNPEILGLVAKYGYTEEKLNEGRSLYERAIEAVNKRIMAEGLQYQETEKMKAAMKEAQDAYANLSKVARAVFLNDKPKLAQLGISGPMPKSTAQLISTGYAVFTNALSNEEIKTALSYYGYDEAKLNSELEKIRAFDSANQSQEAAKGSAQQATREQDEALKNLDNWVSQYIKIARVALQGKKELLEQIGVRVYSSKTPAQREAPKKAAATRKAKKEGN
jgi:hypothetical protein